VIQNVSWSGWPVVLNTTSTSLPVLEAVWREDTCCRCQHLRSLAFFISYPGTRSPIPLLDNIQDQVAHVELAALELVEEMGMKAWTEEDCWSAIITPTLSCNCDVILPRKSK
jgi:hypothetical protein